MHKNDEKLLLSLCSSLRPAMSLPPRGAAEKVSEELAKFADERHRVSSLLYVACESRNDSAASKNAETILKAAYRRNGHTGLRQKAAERKIADLLLAHSVPFSFLKGLALAQQLYEDPLARTSTDVDVLVPPEFAKQAVEVLNGAGYEYCPNTLRNKQLFEKSRQNLELAIHKDATFIDPMFNVPIELHRRLFKFEPDTLTRDFVRSLGTGPNPSLSSSFYCLYLILHGAITLWARLKWIADLSIIARAMSVSDRVEMMRIAETYGCERAVAASLLLMEELFEGSLDEHWRELLAPMQDYHEVPDLRQLFRQKLTGAVGARASFPLKSAILSGSARLVFKDNIAVLRSLFLRLVASLSIRI